MKLYVIKNATQELAELERRVGNMNEGRTIKEIQGVGNNNMSNAIDMDAPLTISLGINNALGWNELQKNIIGMNLNNLM